MTKAKPAPKRKKPFPNDRQLKEAVKGLRSLVLIINHELSFLDQGSRIARICVNTCINAMRHIIDVYDMLAAEHDPKFKERRQKELAKLWDLEIPKPKKPKVSK